MRVCTGVSQSAMDSSSSMTNSALRTESRLSGLSQSQSDALFEGVGSKLTLLPLHL